MKYIPEQCFVAGSRFSRAFILFCNHCGDHMKTGSRKDRSTFSVILAIVTIIWNQPLHAYLTILLTATVSYFFTIFSASIVIKVIMEGFSEWSACKSSRQHRDSPCCILYTFYNISMENLNYVFGDQFLFSLNLQSCVCIEMLRRSQKSIRKIKGALDKIAQYYVSSL